MYFKQIQEIINRWLGIEPGKNQTRRIHKIGKEYAVDANGATVITPDGERVSDAPIYAVYTITPSGAHRLKWRVGQDYAVSPGRGKTGVWWGYQDGGDPYFVHGPDLVEKTFRRIVYDAWREQGLQPLRIVITAIRREPLQAISEADAVAEGWPEDEDVRECPHCDALYPTGWYDGPNLPCTCNPVTWYRVLWESINGAGSWDANPDVWVLEFRLQQSGVITQTEQD